MQVLHVAAGFEVRQGGPPRVVASLTSGLSRAGVSSIVFAAEHVVDHGPLVEAPDASLRLFRTGGLARWWPGHSPDLKRALQREARAADVVHIHEMWHYPHFAAARACKSLGVPFVVSPHGSLDPWALASKQLKKRVYSAIWQRRLLGRAAAAHALTGTEESQLRAYGYSGPVSVIPNGIDVDEFQRPVPPGLMDDRYPELRGKKVILFLGRLHEKKGLDLLVRAFAGLHGTRLDTHLLIVGPDDGYETDVRRMIGEAGIEGSVTLTGPLDGDDRLAAMTRADVYALPSYSEGFSVGVLEALAAGIPVVISTFCYFPEVETAGAGLVTEPDVEEVEAALSTVIDNPELGDRMGKAGKNLVHTGYSWESVASSFIELYGSVAATASS
ncbi:MAG: glycosyltransferase [Dehalococcoidia bacterium]|jgi:glycosyltransferase involved in cell wall biosynthesis|nr:glycosyltransferase [Dehalococcoidia bacterium]